MKDFIETMLSDEGMAFLESRAPMINKILDSIGGRILSTAQALHEHRMRCIKDYLAVGFTTEQVMDMLAHQSKEADKIRDMVTDKLKKN